MTFISCKKDLIQIIRDDTMFKDTKGILIVWPLGEGGMSGIPEKGDKNYGVSYFKQVFKKNGFTGIDLDRLWNFLMSKEDGYYLHINVQ